jgi:hypothetical protein
MQTQINTIDYSLLVELVELIGIESLGDAMQVFARDVGKIAEAMAAAANSGDADEVRRQAHRMRGLGMQFGALGLAQIAGELERDTSSQVLQSARLLIDCAPQAVAATCLAADRLAAPA